MRYLYWSLIILFTAAIILFNLQNLDSVTITFLNIKATLPLALLVIAVYVLGMTTGGLLTAALGQWIRGVRQPDSASESDRNA
ncbi:MAG: LapA family protein [Burkholderiales bacterium]|nr:LapA family protein [Burkholderiales bacterium]MDP2398238.1 LapA family protein [Burkholderiales bacterium]